MKPAAKILGGPGRHVSWILRSSAGAFDLPSILVGVVVVGILTAGVLASIFGVIPFAQDSSSRQDLSSLNTSEGVAKVKDGTFKDKAGLKSSGYLNAPESLSVGTNPAGTCHAGVSKSGSGSGSGSGKMFFNSDTATAPVELTGSATPGCVGAIETQTMISNVGGQTTSVPGVSPKAFKFGVSPTQGDLTTVDSVARVTGEYPSIVETYTDFTRPFDINSINTVIANKSTPLVTWEPFDASVGGTNQPNYTLAKLIDGSYDAYINSVADQLIADGKPSISIRFAHERNGNWYPWSEQVNGNSPGQYVQAWQHVMQLFWAKGITNVDWIWSPNVPYTGSQGIASLYPGDDYVWHTSGRSGRP